MKKKSIFFDETYWEEMCLLLSQNKSVQEILEILRTPKNEKASDKTEYLLRKGIRFEEIVKEMKGKIPERLSFYLTFLPLQKALEAAISFYKFEKEWKSSFVKALLYPGFLFVMTEGILGVFSKIILPEIQKMTGAMNRMQSLKCFITVSELFFGLGILALSGAVFLGFLRKRNYRLYRFIMKHLGLKEIVRVYDTYVFARYYEELSAKGIPTLRIFQYLKAVKNAPAVKFIAEEFDQRLAGGEEFINCLKDPLLDEKFSRMAAVGFLSNTLKEAVKGYLELTEKRIRVFMKRFASGIQILSYVFLGVAAFVVYAALLAPMDILDQF